MQFGVRDVVKQLGATRAVNLNENGIVIATNPNQAALNGACFVENHRGIFIAM